MGDHLVSYILSLLVWLWLAEILGKLSKFTTFYCSTRVLKNKTQMILAECGEVRFTVEYE